MPKPCGLRDSRTNGRVLTPSCRNTTGSLGPFTRSLDATVPIVINNISARRVRARGSSKLRVQSSRACRVDPGDEDESFRGKIGEAEFIAGGRLCDAARYDVPSGNPRTL